MRGRVGSFKRKTKLTQSKREKIQIRKLETKKEG
jgi:hypothetical protein